MILALINGIDITESDYLLELSIRSHQIDFEKIDEQFKQDIIIQLIDDQLILQHAISNNFNVENIEVEESFLNVLLELNQEYDFSEFLINHNIEQNTLMSRVKNQMIIKKFIKETIIKDFVVTEDKLHEVYVENKDCFVEKQTIRVSHILIEGNTEDSLKKINHMKECIKTVEDFFKAVHTCSECPTCCQSGDLGYFTKGQLLPELDEIVFNLDVYEISQPIKTKYGYHLVLVTDKKVRKAPCFEEVKSSLKNKIIEIEVELKVLRLLRQLRESSEIKVFEENIF